MERQGYGLAQRVACLLQPETLCGAAVALSLLLGGCAVSEVGNPDDLANPSTVADPTWGAGSGGSDTVTAGAGGSGGAQLPTAGAGGSGAVDDLEPTGTVDAGLGEELPAPSDDDVERARIVDSFVCPGGKIGPGNSTLMVNGKARTLVADFPKNTSRPMGILFSWHGYNQAEGQHRTASNLQPDADPNNPLVVITPDDIEFELPIGLDWQLDEGSVAKNVDLQFFEAMVGCLNAQYDIDPNRIHSLGYSAGSVMTALLHSVYPKVIRSMICISGMWFNDQNQIDNIIFAGVVLKPTWPALRPEDQGTVLLTHGGLTDIAAGIINLEAMAQDAFPFLKAGNRVVIDCAHGGGHTGSPDVGPDLISRFLSENPSNVETPYLSGGYTGWPGSCMLRLP